MLKFPRASDRDGKSQAICGLVTRLTRTQCSQPKFPPMSIAINSGPQRERSARLLPPSNGHHSDIEGYGTCRATDKLCVISLSVDQLTAFATQPYRSSVPFVPKEYLRVLLFRRLRMAGHSLNALLASCRSHQRKSSTSKSSTAIDLKMTYPDLPPIRGEVVECEGAANRLSLFTLPTPSR